MKDRILEAARKEIQKRGLRFTVGELAKQLGISTKTLYGHFPSKDELIEVILNEAILELQVKERDIRSDSTLNTVDKLKKMLVLIPADFQFIDTNLLIELQRYYPKQWNILEQFINEQWDGIIELINVGVDQGLLRSFNTKIFIDLYVGGLHRIIEGSPKSKNNSTLHDSLQEMGEILMSGVFKKEG
ncbi:TetR/AcrR family transcriptional regulator [Paenibacillus sp. DMB20]|uniref:TetR/AcrR family transcriptional regulator n=1 Tax=Paenibacillus sp. DMB20 TaxID=1642570 RepID=UPI000627B6A4|nr:TetR/AcrR family transcriptional regulator [Paenibacillus sp. DMB20]KKO55482.1 TetR family transcriptional regulator [Paenibacillus sp. DMB20]